MEQEGICKKGNENGGAVGDRTPDLLTASQALSQLSYGPTKGWNIKQYLMRVL